MTPSTDPSTDGGERLAALHADLLARWPESRIDPSLHRIARLMELLGDPQRAYPVVHVAGTNGKSSTARMVESLLRATGLGTGLYTSPHLSSVTERVLLAGEPVSPERFVEAYDDIAPYVEIVDAESVTAGGPAMSYFEVITGLALSLFADAPVDVAVVEVGMGGRWDATNVVDGVVDVVMPIGLDHVDYLGPTLADIAGEKAGIIGAGATAVLAAQPPEAAAVLLDRCVEVGVEPVLEGVGFAVVERGLAVGGQVLTLQTGMGDEAVVYPDVFLPLLGAHQAHNAAAAVAAVQAFLGERPLDIDVVREGLGGAVSPGRLEVLRRSPTVVVDAAHNPHGAAALAAAIADSFAFSHLVAVVGVLADKDVRGILEALEAVVDTVVVTSTRSPRALPADDLAEVARAVVGDERVRVADSVPEAIELAVAEADEAGLASGGGAGVVVTGSVVTVAEARALLGAAS